MPVQNGSVPLHLVPVPLTRLSPPDLSPNNSPDDLFAIEVLSALHNATTAAGAEDLITQAMTDPYSAQFDSAWPALLTSSSPRFRRVSLIMLLRAGKPGALQHVAESSPAELSNLGGTVAGAVCLIRSTEPDDILYLVRLAEPSYPDSIRSCAVYALRSIHTAATLPALAVLLDDSKADIRYDAMAGIAMYALAFKVQTGVPAFGSVASSEQAEASHFPARDLFGRDEQTYISFWKTWITDYKAHQAIHRP